MWMWRRDNKNKSWDELNDKWLMFYRIVNQIKKQKKIRRTKLLFPHNQFNKFSYPFEVKEVHVIGYLNCIFTHKGLNFLAA